MRTFHFYIDDARYGMPREVVVQASHEASARELAERMQAQSEHHHGVEVCEQGARLFGVGTFANRTWCESQRGAA